MFPERCFNSVHTNASRVWVCKFAEVRHVHDNINGSIDFCKMTYFRAHTNALLFLFLFYLLIVIKKYPISYVVGSDIAQW